MRSLPSDQRKVAFQFMLNPLQVKFLEGLPQSKRSAFIRFALEETAEYQGWLIEKKEQEQEAST